MNGTLSFLLVLLVGSSLCQAADSAADLLGRVRAEYRERSRAIRTMRVTYLRMPPGDGKGGYVDGVEPRVFDWVVSGRKQLLTQAYCAEDHAGTVKEGCGVAEPRWDAWSSFDGQHGYLISFWVKNPAEISRVFRTRSLPDALRQHWVPVYLPLNLPYSDIPFVDQLERSGTVVEGEEVIAGANCVRVRMENFEIGRGVPHKLTVWLDKDHQFVQRQSQMSPAREPEVQMIEGRPTNMRLPGELSLSLLTPSLILVNDPVAGRERWFPAAWASLPRKGSTPPPPHLVIKEIRLNETVESSVFLPLTEPGAEVIDQTIDGTQSHSSVIGGEAGVEILRRRQKENSQSPDSEKAAVAAIKTGVEWNGQPPSTSWLPSMAFACAVICFMISTSVAYRRYRAE